ncbi:MAG: hypothetical protein CVU11_03845 [Bacteroidetes bacterium HGW-Bacteroidetes-6]|nr:MAG: hypothetical protein CVU11_03845 [Bacteroidetes bacterium HGW-Bacteroidetes-6]
MKTRILFLLFFVVPVLSFSQINTDNNFIKPDKGSVRSVMGIVHVLDSSLFSDYNSGAWDYTSKRCIQSRHWGSQGLPNEWINYSFDSDMSQWVKYYYERASYQDDSIANYDIVFAKPWSSFINDWTNDTLAYYDYSSAISTQFGVIYENKFIATSYDFLTNSITGGMKYNLFVYADSLYDHYEQFNYNTAINQWDKYWLYSFSYDANNYLQKRLEQLWNASDNVYENVNQYFYIYTNGRLTQEVSQNWSGTVWSNSTKNIYEYDANLNKTKHLHYTWDAVNDVWKPSYQYLYTYTGNNNTEKLYQVWNTGTSSWDNSNRHVYTYNTNSDMLTDRRDLWSAGAWKNDYRYTYTFNTSFLQTLQLYEIWDNGTMAWKNSYRYVYSYDGNDNETNYTRQNWDNMASSWVNDSKSDYTYDSYNSMTLATHSTWNTGTSSWDYESKAEYYWSDFDATNVSDILKNPTSLFPNPTSGIIHFDSGSNEISRITISDLTGKVVYDASTESFSNELDLRPYGRGMYNISITTENNEVYNSKIVVQ